MDSWTELFSRSLISGAGWHETKNGIHFSATVLYRSHMQGEKLNANLKVA
jgi:hypothetical protein